MELALKVFSMSDIVSRFEPEVVGALRQTCRAAREVELCEQYWHEAVRARFQHLVAAAAKAASYEMFFIAAVQAGVSADATTVSADATTVSLQENIESYIDMRGKNLERGQTQIDAGRAGDACAPRPRAL